MKKRKAIFGIASTLLAVIFVVSGGLVWREISSREKEKSDFHELAQQIEDAPVGRNLEPLFQQNPDCIAWLCIPGTQVNYPVMHTPDDPEKYLRRNFQGQPGQSGTPFLDGRCNFDSDNLIIYGHNMRNHSMFGTLKHYLEESYLSKHPVIELETVSGCKEYSIFAVVTVQQSDDWYGFIDAESQEEYEKYLSKLRGKTSQLTGDSPTYGQQLLTLSTCHDSSQQDRLLIVAVQSKG